jgi:hypothetical protein
MGVAIAEQAAGPYVKYSGNPLIPGGHEVLVWPEGKGVMALLNIGPPGIRRTLQYADDGLRFRRVENLQTIPRGAGAYRPEAFTDNGQGEMIEWGLQIGVRKGDLPWLERFDCIQHRKPATTTAP